jgi:hypothetical protein
MTKFFSFGHSPTREPHHFVVSIDRAGSDVQIYEVFQEDEHGPQLVNGNLRCALSWDRWVRIEEFVAEEFNRRLKEQRIRPAKWKTGVNPVSRLLGKELVLLAWAVEEAPVEQAASALANWQGLAPEERWWLYTMTAAQTGDAHRGRGRGWRRAIQFALCENPVATSSLATAIPERKVILKPSRKNERQTSLWRAKLAIPQEAVSLC